MNPSESDREEENLIELLNNIFDIFESNKLIQLKTLANEHVLKQILLSIEPKLEAIGGKIELSTDSSFGIRYANFVSIFNSVYKFIELYPERCNFTEQADFKLKIKINELLKFDQKQLILIGELIIFLSSISSNKDHFDKLEVSDEKHLMQYLSISEKYTIHRSDESILLGKSYNFGEDIRSSISMGYKNIQSQNENMKAAIVELTKELKLKKDIISQNEKTMIELEQKYKDAQREIESFKDSARSTRKVEEELLMDNININKLKAQLSQKELEIADMKKDKDLAMKNLKEEISGLNEKIVLYEDKITGFKSLATENEKLKAKLKEMSFLKDKERELEEMVLNVESKTKMIDNLLKEKQILTSQVDKAQKDFYEGKDKFRQLENEKKKLESELEEIKKDHLKLETKGKDSRDSSVKRGSHIDANESKHMDKCLLDLDQSGLYFEIEKTKDDRMKLLEKELDDLKSERNELLIKSNFLAEDLTSLIAEKKQIVEKMENEIAEKKRVITEKDKLLLEKEKLLIKIQKAEIDAQKMEMNFDNIENEKKKVEMELTNAIEKIKKLNNEKNVISVESEKAKKEQRGEFEKILKEKTEIMLELQKEIERLRSTVDKEKKRGNISQSIAQANNAEDQSILRQEIQNLKTSLAQKDDLIKTLQLKMISLETENTNYSSQLQESCDRFNQDIIKRSEDLEFYKRSYEEQKSRVNREHELISSSLYDLALQFMSLKSELQKKVNSTPQVKSEFQCIEKMKSFPTDKEYK